MGKRKKKNDSFEALITIIVFIIEFIFRTIFRIVVFVFDFVTYSTTKYGIKSGNNFLKMYFDKGNYGEFILYRKVVRIFGQKSVLTNIYLENRNTDTTEIDVLAVSQKGIYVFEMKNFAGYIYGSAKDKNWTQVLTKWNKYKFYNPLKQNYAHTKAVENYLGVSDKKIIPLIVFSDRSKLSKINVGKDQNVFQYSNAMKFIKKHERKSPKIITPVQQEQILINLLKKCNMSEEVKLKHIEDVKELQKKNL